MTPTAYRAAEAALSALETHDAAWAVITFMQRHTPAVAAADSSPFAALDVDHPAFRAAQAQVDDAKARHLAALAELRAEVGADNVDAALDTVRREALQRQLDRI